MEMEFAPLQQMQQESQIPQLENTAQNVKSCPERPRTLINPNKEWPTRVRKDREEPQASNLRESRTPLHYYN
jgi:hypothetical protein